MTNHQPTMPNDQRPTTSDQYVAFRVGDEASGQSYALPIADVREIVRVPEITCIPQSPEFVAGVMNLRGRIIPVIDLRQRLQPGGCPTLTEVGRVGTPSSLAPRPSSPSSRILILTPGGKYVGLLVDAASEVLKIDSTQIDPSPSLFGDAADSYVTGVARHQGRVVVMLDAERLLPHLESPEAVVA